MRTILIAGSIICGITILSGLVWLVGSFNPETPAGYIGYVTQGAIFGQTQFLALQRGPTSYGRKWLARAINVSITPYTYSEPFEKDTSVLSKDNLKISFSVHTVWKVKPDLVKEFVEKFSAGDCVSEEVVRLAYDNFIKEPLRTFARDEVQKLNGLDIKDQIVQVSQNISNRTKELTTNTPFDIISIVVGNIQYPDSVANAVADKLATTQTLEKKRTEIEIEKQEKEKRIIQAEGIAKSMEIINERLTPNYLQHEAIESQKMILNSPNCQTVVYIPSGSMGVPLVGTFDTLNPRASK